MKLIQSRHGGNNVLDCRWKIWIEGMWCDVNYNDLNWWFWVKIQKCYAFRLASVLQNVLNHWSLRSNLCIFFIKKFYKIIKLRLFRVVSLISLTVPSLITRKNGIMIHLSKCEKNSQLRKSWCTLNLWMNQRHAV